MIAIQKNSSTAIIVLHEIYGINQHMQYYCEKLGQQGFDVFCPDLLQRGQSYEYSLEQAAYVNFVENVGFSNAASKIEHLITKIRNNYKYVFVLGFSVGATIAWICSKDERLDGVIGYYGSRIRDYLEIKPHCPVQLNYGHSEKSVDLDPLVETLRKKENFTIHRFDGEHGFADPYSSKYSEGEAKRAWYEVLDFIHLNSVQSLESKD